MPGQFRGEFGNAVEFLGGAGYRQPAPHGPYVPPGYNIRRSGPAMSGGFGNSVEFLGPSLRPSTPIDRPNNPYGGPTWSSGYASQPRLPGLPFISPMPGAWPRLHGLSGLGATPATCPPGPLTGNASCACPKGTELMWHEGVGWDEGFYVCGAKPGAQGGVGGVISNIGDYLEHNAGSIVIGALCAMFKIGCPTSATGQTLPPWPVGAVPWYSTTGGALAIGLGAIAAGVVIYKVAT